MNCVRSVKTSTTLFFLFTLICLLILAIDFPAALAANANLPGDVDGNRKIESADARLALRASVALETYEKDSAAFLAADVDNSGRIESSDARMILRASVGLERLGSVWNPIRTVSVFSPTEATWSLWTDMPDNSCYTGPVSGFAESVEAEVEWNDSDQCQVLKLEGTIYIACPRSDLLLIGQPSDDQATHVWMTSGPQKPQEIIKYVFSTSDAPTFYLAPPEDDSDMTETIQSMLDNYRYCRLGPGDFNVTGITLPANGMLQGCGSATRLILSPSVDEGAAIRLASYSCVKDICLRGAAKSIKISAAVGERHGVLLQGNATAKGASPFHATVENVTITDFTGGGITCRDTGYNMDTGMNVSDCHIIRCGAGINISYFSEYHRFTNISSVRCRYGCIDNGGNNVFVNCSFSGNTIGLLMDNSKGQSKNSSHGSFTNCLFNHSDNNDGYAIIIIGMKNGQIFNGSQIFFGKTLIRDSQGIQFIGSNMGKKTEIEIDNSTSIIFSNCTISDRQQTPITINNGKSIVFSNCYCYDGSDFGITEE